MDLGTRAAGIGALAEPLRRALYEYVAGAPGEVSREQAATALDVPVHTAKFHLDRLVEEGLLVVDFRRLSGRTGPGAGRPSKLYRRSPVDIAVSLPERRYDLVGHLLATAVERVGAGHGELPTVLAQVAVEEGRRTGREHGAEPPDEDSLDRVSDVLAADGYEPRRDADVLELANCPFDSLATGHTELVCGLNRSYVEGVADGVEAEDLQACLEPEDGLCCVKVRRCS